MTRDLAAVEGGERGGRGWRGGGIGKGDGWVTAEGGRERGREELASLTSVCVGWGIAIFLDEEAGEVLRNAKPLTCSKKMNRSGNQQKWMSYIISAYYFPFIYGLHL